jgi:hypothetical protein
MLSPKQTIAGRESARVGVGDGTGTEGDVAAAGGAGSSLPEHPVNTAATAIHHAARIHAPTAIIKV